MRKKVVKITWDDAASDTKTWVRPDDMAGLCEIITVGIFIEKTKDHICIAHSMAEDGFLCGVFFIPRGCVKKIEYLTEVKSCQSTK